MENIPFHIEIIGLLAATLTTFSFVPQVYMIWKKKSAENVSLTMFLMFFVGILLWLSYGCYLNSLPVILANIVTGLLSLVIIYCKFKYK